MNRLWQILSLVLFATIVLLGLVASILLIRASPLWTADSAAWFQAVGAIIAIFIAIWVPYWQREHALDAAKESAAAEVHNVLRNLLDEMIVVSEGFRVGNGKILLDTPAGEPFDSVIPIMDRPFPIFDASAAKLGLIPNDELRRHIIAAYGRANAFVSSVRLNNVLVDRYEEADYLLGFHKDELHQRLFDVRHETLVRYAEALKGLYLEATEKMLVMRSAIESELEIG